MSLKYEVVTAQLRSYHELSVAQQHGFCDLTVAQLKTLNFPEIEENDDILTRETLEREVDTALDNLEANQTRPAQENDVISPAEQHFNKSYYILKIFTLAKKKELTATEVKGLLKKSPHHDKFDNPATINTTINKHFTKGYLTRKNRKYSITDKGRELVIEKAAFNPAS